mgnify:CR=1 FL=1
MNTFAAEVFCSNYRCKANNVEYLNAGNLESHSVTFRCRECGEVQTATHWFVKDQTGYHSVLEEYLCIQNAKAKFEKERKEDQKKALLLRQRKKWW